MNRLPTFAKTLVLTFLLATPLYSYVTLKRLSSTNKIVQLKWAGAPLSWQMNPGVGANVTGAREQGDVMRQSFRTWSSIPTAAITFAERPAAAATVNLAYDGMNVVSTNLTSSEWSAFGVGSSVLAFTAVVSFDMGGIVDALGRPVSFPGQIMDADIVFNPSYEFSTDDDTALSGKLDFQSVLTHEIGHFLGLDHSPTVSSTMFWTILSGLTGPRTPGTDDIAGVSSIYPAASFSSKGTLRGTVRTTANMPVYGAVVVALNNSGQPVASAITDPSGQYTIMGLDSGSYTVYAQTLEGFTTSTTIKTLSEIYAGQTVDTSFTARFR
ncbi:MAG TPA: matrixin family metalloprotease [Terriglobia bacterium]|nr:matrixin family metalloprotease [Terriglobia bacterium]